MQFLKKLNLKKEDVLKGVGLAVLVVVALVFGKNFLGISSNRVMSISGSMPQFYASDMDASYAYGEESVALKEYASAGYGAPTLSIRNISPIYPPVPQPVTTPGSDAEEFEVTEYSGTIESRKVKETCGVITDWKAFEYVVFESANESERYCNYRFKVEHAHVAEILAKVNELDPRELSENTYTIKNQITDFTSETEILEKKLASIDETLKNALTAYDQITSLAVRTQDADALAKIIDSKLQLIERLTQERLNTSAHLDRLTRSKAEQLDRLEYTYFSLSVKENNYVDGQALKDSWKQAFSGFVRDLNRIVQGLTINLVLVLFITVQALVYLFFLMYVAKFVWKWARQIWKK